MLLLYCIKIISSDEFEFVPVCTFDECEELGKVLDAILSSHELTSKIYHELDVDKLLYLYCSIKGLGCIRIFRVADISKGTLTIRFKLAQDNSISSLKEWVSYGEEPYDFTLKVNMVNPKYFSYQGNFKVDVDSIYIPKSEIARLLLLK